MKKLRDYLPFFITAFVVLSLYLLTILIWHPAIVSGNSMSPTFVDGDILVCSLDTKDIKRGDIVVFKHNSVMLIKRVIGLPGETVGVKDGKFLINGKTLDDYTYGDVKDPGLLVDDEMSLYDDQYFLVGDNVNESIDSRKIGAIDSDDIKTVVIKMVYRKRR